MLSLADKNDMLDAWFVHMHLHRTDIESNFLSCIAYIAMDRKQVNQDP